MKPRLTHIVPEFAPSLDAVGQYALKIGEQHAQLFETHYVVLSRNIAEPNPNISFAVHRFLPDSEGWRDALRSLDGVIILHYSGYGYAPKGVPRWLPLDLERALRHNQKLRLITVFHELAAHGPIWSSAFWLSPAQSQICDQILTISSRVLVTHSANHAQLLQRNPFQSARLSILPLCATVDEPSLHTSPSSRRDNALVFGTHGRRVAVYRADPALVTRILDALGISSIIDVGTGTHHIPDTFCGRPVQRLGALTSTELGPILSSASLGILEYPARLLGKSSILAAYAAYGVPTLLVRHESDFHDGLTSQEVMSLQETPSRAQAQDCGEALKKWYTSHTQEAHARLLSEFARDVVQTPSPINPPKKVALFMSQTTQNNAPFRLMARQSEFNFLSVLLSRPDQPALWRGEEFLNKSMFQAGGDHYLPTTILTNISPVPSLNSWYGLINRGIRQIVRESDCVVVYGHRYFSFWIAMFWAKWFGKPLILSNDAISLGPSRLKAILKRLIFPVLYRSIAHHVLVTSSRSKQFLSSLGINTSRITVTPYSADNEWIAKHSERRTREEVRNTLALQGTTEIILFCGKLISRKNPLELINAFATMRESSSVLIIVGDGPLRPEIDARVETLGIQARVHMLGFVPYVDLPSLYRASDIVVHPASDEPFGLVVNEAFVCGTCVVTSDRVGSAFDLISHGETGFSYPSGDVARLREILEMLLQSPKLRSHCAERAKQRISSWGPRQNVDRLAEAIRISLL